MKISYAITVCNEEVELTRLLFLLKKHKREQDEICVLLDTTKASTNFVNKLQAETEIKLKKGMFEGDFASWKNKLNDFCTGDYIFQIDADEYPDIFLINLLPQLLDENQDVDVFLVPRVNTVEGLTMDHINKWSWSLNEKGYVNWPDYQMRIYKNNEEIRWFSKVHEKLQGFHIISPLPAEEKFALYHPKTIERQERQNAFYDTIIDS